MNDTRNNTFIWAIFIPAHITAVLAVLALPWTLDWTVALYLFLGWLLLPGLGSAVGLHRVFSHRAIQLRSWLTVPVIWLSSLCLQGNTLTWTATHRGRHHRYSDTDRDPHSPRLGFYQSYLGWIFGWQSHFEPRHCIDLVRDCRHLWFAKNYIWVIAGTYLVAGLASWQFLVYALIVPAALSYHQESLVNWFSHQRQYGYRSFDTSDNSVNNRWLAVFTWGQALHNNHHHDPRSFSFARQPGEFDPANVWRKVLEQ